MRVLVGPDTDDLDELYAVPADRTDGPWLRVNMITTLDGAATGDSGRSGSINNAVDQQVFDRLRALADVIVVGAGTARVEGYGPADRPIVVVSRSGEVPEGLRGAPPGSVLVEPLGDAATFKRGLADRGWSSILCEGGPSLLRDLLAAGVVDELCTTTVPRVIGGEHPRIVAGPPVDVPLRLHTLLEQDGTLLARWLV
ncbi:dihydrofolate reductase family protein [Nocardioides sp. LMS-CY]|uniref:dihydrofolate reductase family protein n=1 Tax=Nocardioides sp. (strain LMS-CY) TaxID=2840457 RepID=UPI001C0016BE|nr:dihydrofolate reductase family protein [Nocardioides sp. LMS-CY]QWF21677.1 dihydrofolate reductase family protein [Nocardioides sp. LMS-CY]